MEFKVERRKPVQNINRDKDDLDIAYRFARTMWKEFDRFIRAIVLFGSTAREEGPHGDIDILVIVDDVSFLMNAELVEAYRVITESHVIKISHRLHITTLKFTSFWDYVRSGDPVGINILREGVALIDTGFFYPLQMLLYDGRIRPTKEAVHAYMARSTSSLHSSSWHIMQAVMDLYWACIDASHAALMHLGEIPSGPKDIAAVLHEKMVKPGYLHGRHANNMDKIYKLSKRIIHREQKELSGREFDTLQKEAKEFVEEMKRFIEKHK